MTITTFEQKKIAYYHQKGEGIPLVFVHGFCADSSIWDHFISFFPDRNILRVDIPGFGHSEQINNYSITRYADVIHAVLQELNIESCIYIGHSMGGYIGLEFAKKYGNLLKGFCLFHSHPYADTDEKIANRKKSIEFINKVGPIYYVKQLMPALFPPKYENSNHLELAKLVFNASKYSAENIIASLEAMIGRVDNTTILAEMDFPVLFIIGKKDTVVPDYLNETAKPNISSIHVLKDVAHMGMLERPKQCQRIIKDYLDLLTLMIF